MSASLAETPLSTAELAGADCTEDHHRAARTQGARVIERDERVTSPSLTRVYPLVVGRGAGGMLEDVDGNRFLDFNAGIAVNAAGHAHPAVTAAIIAQAERSCTTARPTSTTRCTPSSASGWPLGADARRQRVPRQLGHRGGRGALKLARYYTGGPNVIAFFGAFHGRSLGSLSLTASKARHRSGFGIARRRAATTPRSPSTASSRRRVHRAGAVQRITEPSDVAAMFVEPIQGEGGYIVPPPVGSPTCAACATSTASCSSPTRCSRGIGRTGKMWACEHDGVDARHDRGRQGPRQRAAAGGADRRADIMHWTAGKHGSTFGGNPVACAAALATLDLVERVGGQRRRTWAITSSPGCAPCPIASR